MEPFRNQKASTGKWQILSAYRCAEIECLHNPTNCQTPGSATDRRTQRTFTGAAPAPCTDCYLEYYNVGRMNLLDKEHTDAPRRASRGRIKCRFVLGGLHPPLCANLILRQVQREGSASSSASVRVGQSVPCVSK